MSSSADGVRFQDRGAPPYLDVHDAVSGGGQHTVRTVGELDLATAPELEAVLSRLDSPRALTLDLSGLTFMDCRGLRSVLSVGKACEKPVCRFKLIQGQAQVRRLFELTGLLDVLPFQPAA
jgi:stage II sporulation protein AA (anti-sigma F factor antagonist)